MTARSLPFALRASIGGGGCFLGLPLPRRCKIIVGVYDAYFGSLCGLCPLSEAVPITSFPVDLICSWSKRRFIDIVPGEIISCCLTKGVYCQSNLPRDSLSLSCCLPMLLIKSLALSFVRLTIPSEGSFESELPPAELFLGLLPCSPFTFEERSLRFEEISLHLLLPSWLETWMEDGSERCS